MHRRLFRAWLYFALPGTLAIVFFGHDLPIPRLWDVWTVVVLAVGGYVMLIQKDEPPGVDSGDHGPSSD